MKRRHVFSMVLVGGIALGLLVFQGESGRRPNEYAVHFEQRVRQIELVLDAWTALQAARTNTFDRIVDKRRFDPDLRAFIRQCQKRGDDRRIEEMFGTVVGFFVVVDVGLPYYGEPLCDDRTTVLFRRIQVSGLLGTMKDESLAGTCADIITRAIRENERVHREEIGGKRE